MKIYGNSKSDGFSLFVTLIAAMFVAGGFVLGHDGGITLAVSALAIAGLFAAMVVAVRKWDVMSEIVHAEAGEGVPVRLPNFPVKADTEATVVPMTFALPSSVEKPKVAVETNTAVAA